MKRLMLLCGLVALFAVPAAFAGTSKSSFTIDQRNVAYGDTVTFSNTFNNARMVSVQCFALDANGNLDPSRTVYQAQKPVGSSFTLSGWDSSAASCGAVLWSSGKDLARTYFSVSGVY